MRSLLYTLVAALAALLLCGAGAVALPAAALPASDEGLEQYKKGVDHFYSLEYDQAIAAFEKLRDADPDNPSRQNDVATQDVVSLLVRLLDNPTAAEPTWAFIQQRWPKLRAYSDLVLSRPSFKTLAEQALG